MLQWTFTVPNNLELDLAGQWVALLEEPQRPVDSLPMVANRHSGLGELALHLNVTIAQSLAQAARFPLFEPPTIVDVRAKAGLIWVAYLELPVADEASGQQWQALLGSSQRILAWVAERPTLFPGCLDHRQSFLDFVGAQLATLPPPIGGKSIYHILKEAYGAGIPTTHIAGTVYQLGWGAKARRIDRSITDKEGLIGARLTQNKVLTAQLLHQAGLPSAFHACVTDAEAARSAARSIGWPVVIKPADAERGEGVTVDVQPEQLEEAFSVAIKASSAGRVLVERQVAGVCHRLFIAGGKLLYAVKRLPIGVYGNGHTSLSELIAAQAALMASRPPWERDHVPTLDALSHAELKRQGITAANVPLHGQFVSLRRVESTASGGIDEDVTHLAHPENIRVAEAAARVAGLSVAGVDMISSDIAKPWYENAAIINEVNYAPMLGEGLISRRHVRTYVDRLMGGNGRIPVAAFVGGKAALEGAIAQANHWHAEGLRAAVTSHDETFFVNGASLSTPQMRLFDRIKALVLSSEVEALAIAVINDALMDTGLPLEGVDSAKVCGPAALSARSHMRRRLLLEMLEGWPWPSADR